MTNKPDFFIVGAPKCGTTALSEYLRAHPNIHISTPKEPHYFVDDFPSYKERMGGEENYLALFDTDKENAQCGEASVWYLYSKVAIQNALDFNPNAKFIAMVRNPLEMAVSLHAQLVWTLDEDTHNFDEAWSMMDERKAGRKIPKKCRESAFLQYREACQLGGQIERFMNIVPPSQRTVSYTHLTLPTIYSV